MSNTIGGNSFSNVQSINSYQSSHESRELFSNDKCSVHHDGGDDFTLQDKRSGDSHRCQGDFGQSGLQDAHGQDKLIDQIVKKVLEKIGEKLGIDLSGLIDDGSQTSPDQGQMGGRENDHSVHNVGGSYPQAEYLRHNPQPGASLDRPMPGDFLGLGNQQNVKDHNAIGRLFDPMGFF